MIESRAEAGMNSPEIRRSSGREGCADGIPQREAEVYNTHKNDLPQGTSKGSFRNTQSTHHSSLSYFTPWQP